MSTANSYQNEPMYEWQDLPWKLIERAVFKLQKRIYQASKDDQVQKYISCNGFYSPLGRPAA